MRRITASQLRMVVVSCVLFVTQIAVAQQVGIIGVGVDTGGSTAVAALSASGDVAVGSHGPSYSGAFRWARTSATMGTTTVLPQTDGNDIHGTAVTADGQVVFGYSSERVLGTQQYHSVRWRPPYSSSAPLSSLSGGCGGGGVESVTSDGAFAVGYYSLCAPFCSRGASTWTVPESGPGTPWCLGLPSNWHLQTAVGISGNGSVVVGTVTTQNDTFDDTAYAWLGTPGGAGAMEILPPLSGGGTTGASQVSRDGSVVIGGSGGEGVRWRVLPAAGPAEALGRPTGWAWINPHGVSAHGSVIVGDGVYNNAYRAMIWVQGEGAFDLNAYAAAQGVDLTGWVLTDASATSDDGHVIGGAGTHTINGTTRMEGFVLTLPRLCGSADFNHDGDSATDADIEAFFACIAGNCCAACDSADFNGDGDTATDADIEAFFRVLAGGNC
jgi:uncharacterized membrane protein